jgi:hypothetical protein
VQGARRVQPTPALKQAVKDPGRLQRFRLLHLPGDLRLSGLSGVATRGPQPGSGRTARHRQDGLWVSGSKPERRIDSAKRRSLRSSWSAHLRRLVRNHQQPTTECRRAPVRALRSAEMGPLRPLPAPPPRVRWRRRYHRSRRFKVVADQDTGPHTGSGPCRQM